GDIPPRLGDLAEVVTLNLGGNELTGEIPVSLGNLTSMRSLFLQDNLLVGKIPDGIGALVARASLDWTLHLQNNYLSGTVPDNIPYLTETELESTGGLKADLSGNLLTDWPDQRNGEGEKEALTIRPFLLCLSNRQKSTLFYEPFGIYKDTKIDTLDTPLPPNAGSVTEPPQISSDAAEGSSSLSPPRSEGWDGISLLLIIAIGAVGSALILIGTLIVCLVCRRKRRRGRKEFKEARPSSQREWHPSLLVVPEKSFMSVSADGTGEVGVGGAGNGGDGDEDEENTCYSWTRGDSDIMYRSNQKNLGNNGNSSNIAASRTGSEAAGRLRASDVYFPAAGGKAEGAATTDRAMDGNGSSYTSSSTTATMGSATADGASEATGDLTTAALAAVEALAQDLFVPGVREASSVVAGLVRMVSDNKDNAGDVGQRETRCRSIVDTLGKAGKVLGKVPQNRCRDSGETGALREDVRDSIAGMVQIMQSYRSKSMFSRVFVSDLFRKRQEEAEESINACVQRLQLGLGIQLESVGGAVRDSLECHRHASEQKARTMKRRRRQKRLEQLEIPTSEVEITDEVLGRGGFGNVYLADLNGLNAAAKVIVFEDDTYEDEDEGEDDFDDADGDGGSDKGRHQHTALKLGTPTTAAAAAAPTGKDRSPLAQSSPPQSRERRQLRRAFMLELEAMKRLKGPHTVAIYGAVTSLPDRLVLVMELLPGGDLRHRLRRAKEPLDGRVLRQIVRDVCCGMAFLHAKATVHGDLKSANVLFNGAGRAKIADFGTSLWTQHSTRLSCTIKSREFSGMSLPWSAPEILNRRGPSFKSDVYSFGMVVWECLARKTPWKGVAGVDNLLLAVVAGERPPVPENAPVDLAALARACWAHDPAARPTFKETLAGFNLNANDYRSVSTMTSNN
ncbi:unnamed protein product, partial [Pylaiella littoralis]